MNYQKERFYCCPGSPLHIIYAPKVEKDGSVVLVESGVENTDEYIQSFKESTDLAVILARVANGEENLLYQRPGSYGDFTKLPQTYAEALQLQIDSNNLFKSLPVEVKQKFNNDASQFFAQSGTVEWYEKIEQVLPNEVKELVRPSTSLPVDPVSEVKE